MEDDRRFIETARLDRIENKLDRLTEHVSRMGRIDERVIILERTTKELSSRFNSTEIKTNEVTLKVNSATKLLWVLFASLASALVAYFFKA